MKYLAGFIIVIVLGILLAGASALFQNINAGTTVPMLKVLGMWGGLALIIHFLNIRVYMLAWLASGHQSSFKVKWHDFLFEIALYLGTLALWLDHYGKL